MNFPYFYSNVIIIEVVLSVYCSFQRIIILAISYGFEYQVLKIIIVKER